MNDLIVQAILDEFVKASYEWEFGGRIVTLEDAKKILCKAYNVDEHKITVKSDVDGAH
jgi:hypothetical protein